MNIQAKVALDAGRFPRSHGGEMSVRIIRKKIVRRKGSHNRLLFLLECGHVKAMPTCSPKAWQVGKLLRCQDCERAGEGR
jgi:hypothetical protein